MSEKFKTGQSGKPSFYASMHQRMGVKLSFGAKVTNQRRWSWTVFQAGAELSTDFSGGWRGWINLPVGQTVWNTKLFNVSIRFTGPVKKECRQYYNITVMILIKCSLYQVQAKELNHALARLSSLSFCLFPPLDSPSLIGFIMVSGDTLTTAQVGKACSKNTWRTRTCTHDEWSSSIFTVKTVPLSFFFFLLNSMCLTPALHSYGLTQATNCDLYHAA